MLTNLFIQNIVLIEKLDIAFDDGFCVLTGETGAGKSILLGALGLAMGKRASQSLIRTGQKQGTVTANFSSDSPIVQGLLAEQAIEYDGEIFLRRVVYDDGKSKSFINDTPVSINFLSQVAENLIEIHGQHDQRGLFDTKTHRLVIDRYGNLEAELEEVSKLFAQYKSLKKQLSDLKENESKAQAEEEYLKFVLKELTELEPKAGLEEELATKRSTLLNRDKFIETINEAIGILQESDVDASLSRTQTILQGAASLNKNFENIAQMLERASIEINEAISELSRESETLDESEDNLEIIEERLFALRNASRKYNVATDDLENYITQVAQKLDLIENKEKHISDLIKNLEQAEKSYLTKARDLSAKRADAAKKLEKSLIDELIPLKMENTKLQVSIENLAQEQWSGHGIDKIEFLVSTNIGQPFAPLAKIASGGELSRLMLALKVVLSDVKSVPTMIFDEVDTGIGGAVADAVGRRLGELGKKLQVFAITHQPQVAARGNFHLKVEKSSDKLGTTTTVRVLDNNMRTEELARMLSGDSITDQARNAAKSLMGA